MQLPAGELLPMRSAIKLLASNTALESGLAFEHTSQSIDSAAYMGHGCERSQYTTNQYSRLLNRQVKVAFFMLQKSLLAQVLNNLTQLLSQSDSGATPLFMLICLTFLLEQIEMTSRSLVVVAQRTRNSGPNHPGTIRDVAEYRRRIENEVFHRLYKMASIKIAAGGWTTNAASSQLASRLRKLRERLGMSGPPSP
jgi:hypothetical protein